MKDWIIKHLLDKNGNPSRMKKKKYLTDDVLQEMRILSSYQGSDINSLIFSVLHDVGNPTCQHCGNSTEISKDGKSKMFCSLTCLNLSDHMKEAVKKRRSVEEQAAINKKRKHTNLKKYGVEHVLQIPGKAQEVKEKSNAKRIKTLRKRAQEHYARYGLNQQQTQANWSKETIEKLDDIDLLNELYYTQGLSLHEMADIIDCSPSSVSNALEKHGFKTRQFNRSVAESQIYKFLCDHIDADLITSHDRKTFGNKIELDLHIPSYGVAIEHHGVYWHSYDQSNISENKDRHVKKYQMCLKRGIHLIQIFEDEWQNKTDICKSIILNALRLNHQKIYARQTEVRFVDTHEAINFLTRTHINGYANAKHKVGLYYNDQLVSVMTFGQSRFDTKYDFELIRFASELNTNIVGGASKMLSFFRKHYSGSIITYSDHRFGSGSVYEKIGFEKDSTVQPGYFWFYNKARLTRYRTRKSKLVHILGKFYDPLVSEDINMFRAGARKIFDAGHTKYILY